MKFLKINAKVLLILCLFSGILFLSTGCGEKDKEKDATDTPVVDNNSKESDGSSSNNSSASASTDTNQPTNEATKSVNNEKVDYSVWVANTTINTDKNQRSYKVIWGDTLWLISTAWEVPYQEIATYNHIPNPDLIYVDQVIYNPLFK